MRPANAMQRIHQTLPAIRSAFLVAVPAARSDRDHPGAGPERALPSIVFIETDDPGYGDLGTLRQGPLPVGSAQVRRVPPGKTRTRNEPVRLQAARRS